MPENHRPMRSDVSKTTSSENIRVLHSGHLVPEANDDDPCGPLFATDPHILSPDLPSTPNRHIPYFLDTTTPRLPEQSQCSRVQCSPDSPFEDILHIAHLSSSTSISFSNCIQHTKHHRIGPSTSHETDEDFSTPIIPLMLQVSAHIDDSTDLIHSARGPVQKLRLAKTVFSHVSAESLEDVFNSPVSGRLHHHPTQFNKSLDYGKAEPGTISPTTGRFIPLSPTSLAAYIRFKSWSFPPNTPLQRCLRTGSPNITLFESRDI